MIRDEQKRILDAFQGCVEALDRNNRLLQGLLTMMKSGVLTFDPKAAGNAEAQVLIDRVRKEKEDQEKALGPNGVNATQESVVKAARSSFIVDRGLGDDLDIDDDARITPADEPDRGCWVQAWVFVPRHHVK